jgi:hypothetical protein
MPVISEAVESPPITAAVSPGQENAAGQTIFNSSNAYPFTLQAVFQNFCMFRWEILRERDRQIREEKYFLKGETLAIPQIQNGVRFWVANASAVKFELIGGARTHTLEVGGVGEVVVADVTWVRDNDGRFRLVMNRID